MSEYVTLLGAEDIVRAAREMTAAAESIRQSVGHLEEILRQDRRERELAPQREGS